MKNLLLTIISLSSLTLYGQHYYNDIIGSQEISTKMKAFQAAKVQSVSATGYDDHGTKTTDFNEWQDVQGNGSILKITTRNGQNVSRVYYQFDDKTRLISSRDSTADAQTITDYTYDASGKLVKVKVTIIDPEKEFNDVEEREWQYATTGIPKLMTRILNARDTTEFRFTPDKDGNVADETPFRKVGKDTVTYFFYENKRIYYYYDDKDRLTDIVRFNNKTKQLMPDVMFEYDDNNRVIQRITTVSAMSTSRDYFIWRYAFSDKGVKTKEALFNKYKELKGRIDYSYTFTP